MIESDWTDPPDDSWFLPPTLELSEDEKKIDEYIFRRLSLIRKKTLRCQTRLAHEASWNDSVHAPLLEMAFDEDNHDDVFYQNV